MSDTPEKCPKCQSPVVPPYLWQYGCGTTFDGVESELCETRAKLSEMRNELEKAKSDAESWHQQAQQRLDDANEFGRKWEEAKADAESWKAKSEMFEKQLLETSEKLAATKRELAQARAECGIAHDQCRDAENERRNETHRATIAEARVRELEGLELNEQYKAIGGTWVEVWIPRDVTMGMKTLGEAMPRKEGV